MLSMYRGRVLRPRGWGDIAGPVIIFRLSSPLAPLCSCARRLCSREPEPRDARPCVRHSLVTLPFVLRYPGSSSLGFTKAKGRRAEGGGRVM